MSNSSFQAAPSNAAQAFAARGYQLVWSDEFDRDGWPDATKWRFEKGFSRNFERQWYQPQNAFIDGGKLIIEGRKEAVPNPAFVPGSADWKKKRQFSEYSSACLITRGLHSWRYGIWEMRGRIPTGPGMWPAWWTIGTRRGWPAAGEIDIMEYYRGILLANVFYAGAPGGKAKVLGAQKKIATFPDPKWSEQFHTWRMEWDEKRLKLFVDDALLNEVDVAQTVNLSADGANPYHEPHFMLLNLAIGGGQGGGKTQVEDGVAGEALPGGDPSQSTYPQRFEVDYVRVYQTPAQIESQKLDAEQHKAARPGAK